MSAINKHKWLICLFCLALISVRAGAQHLPFINYNTHNGLPQIQVQELHQDSKGYIWIGTKGGLAKFNGSSFQQFLHNEYIYGMDETLDGDLYFFTFHNLYKYDRDTMTNVASLTKLLNRALYERMSLICGKDNCWIFTDTEMLEFRADTLYQIIHSGVDFEGRFKSMTYDRKNDRILFSSSKNRIYGLNDKEITELSRFEIPVRVSSFSDGTIYYHLLPSESEHIYIDPESGQKFLRYKEDTLIHDVEVYKLPTRQHSLERFDTRQYLLLDSTTNSVKPIKLPFEEEYYPFLIDKDNNYWVGTDNGLYQINNKAFRAYPRTFMNNFWTMIRGKDGKYYGAQHMVGLFQLDLTQQGKKEIVVKEMHGAHSKSFYYGSSMDKQGNLYFPTHTGLVKYDCRKTKFFDTGVSMISKYDPYENKIVFGHNLGIGFIGEDEKIEAFIDSTGKKLS